MSLFNLSDKAYLLLANGMVFEGYSLGKKGSVIGEVVFTTGLTGYQETLTDPSYYGQIVTQTFPLIGNYGVNDEDFESKKSFVSGYIVREWCNAPSNFRSSGDINDFLIKQNIIGIHSVDTRSLTRMIRETGVMNGMITTNQPDSNISQYLDDIRNYKISDAVKSVAIDSSQSYSSSNPKYKIALYDFGYKYNIRNELLNRNCDVIVVPPDTSPETLKSLKPDGIMLSNGPGDPAENESIIKNLQKICLLNIPIFGICLGHQLMALANGGKTHKLKYGHRGANQPVIDLNMGRTFVTSQNHGYAVINDSISTDNAEVSHVNANDKTCEGIRYKNINAFTVQFHPEAHGGPLDTAYLFDEFISMVADYRRNQ